MATESSLNGAAAVVRALRDNGVGMVFGIPGTHNLEIYRHLAASGIRHVAPRHEQGGGYAADAYARVSGRPGVCVTTSGPGLTNIATAAATAYADSVPLLVISPAAPLGQERADVGWLHEVKDQRAAMDALYDRSVRAGSPAQAAAVVHETFARWRVERPRPVHLELPLDVLEAPWDGHAPGPLTPAALRAPDEVLAAAVSALRGAAAPLIVLGGGARDASAQAVRLAELLGAPVATSVSGKGVVPESHPLSAGASVSLAPVQEAVEAADVLLVVGSELASSDLWEARLSPRGTVIRVDVDLRQLHKNVPADIAVHGEARTVLAALCDALADRRAGEDGRERAARLREAAAGAAMEMGSGWRAVQDVLRGCLPGDTIVAGDSAQVSYFGTVPFWPMEGPRRFVYPTGYATLGYAIPAAIGAKLAAPDTTVIALAGDGGTLFSIQELAVAAELGMPLPVVVMNNHGYAEIREEMRARDIPETAVDIRGVDFPGLGRAFGGHGERLDGLDDLPAAVERALKASGPTVIEIAVP
ncbi:5-guanidino-2-oxopentanoate decarboxylase [Nonomuraea sediminis]|uniref:5-guanidino-2-oxopentanoate decarboxylase n=1 Tax=Nonomuraea sediminis TaxID=2835864 RepID=UPI001BDDB20C|nr:5-guanidino-2-oxopentanoate decarboxylase [Nonomuraea sediminis]